MKNKINILIVLFVSTVMWSCEDPLKQQVNFNVNASTDAGAISGTTFNITAGTPVTFNFSGNPDFITFYSGEAGHEYDKRNLLETPAEDITSLLKFNAKPQYGVIEGTLKVFLSTSFEGLRGNDKKADSLAIINNQWTDITSLCNLPTVSNGTVDLALPLNDYLGKKLTVAFQYKTDQNTTTQPTWIISGLLIENTIKSSGAISSIKASTMGFQVLDMLAATSPYKNTGGSGTWSLANIATEMRMQSSPSGALFNNDWLISNPILVNSRPADLGVAIKKIALDVNSYTYAFKTPGTYVVTFLGRNENYKASSEVARQFTVTVQ